MRAEPIRCFICIDVFLRRVSAAAEERKYFFGSPASAGYFAPLSIHFIMVAHTHAFLSQPPSFFFFSPPVLACWCAVCCQQQQSNLCHEALGTHIPHASHDCHALRYHSGAHGGGVPMPPRAPSAPRTAFWYCILYWVGAAAFSFFLVRSAPTAAVSTVVSSDPTLKSSLV